MLFPIEEIAAGDYSPEYGHVAEVKEVGPDNSQILVKFVNGKEITVAKGEDIEFINGGRF